MSALDEYRAFLQTAELSAGALEYVDTAGGGATVVLLHGVAMDGSVWRSVIAELRSTHRLVVPTLPLGAHRLPMRADADLSLAGQARLVSELLDRLELQDVTLVQNDVGVGLVLASERPARVTRLVLISCEAFDNYPPGLPGRLLTVAARVPGGLNTLLQPMRLRLLRRLPIAYGWLAKHGIPDEVTDRWLQPALSQPRVRHDLARYLRAADRREMMTATMRLQTFDKPALVVWAVQDRLMPRAHGQRLAQLIPQARLVEIADSYTLVPEDQPHELARVLREFVAD